MKISKKPIKRDSKIETFNSSIVFGQYLSTNWTETQQRIKKVPLNQWMANEHDVNWY